MLDYCNKWDKNNVDAFTMRQESNEGESEKSVGLPTSEFNSRNRRENCNDDIMFIFQLFDYHGSVAYP